PPRQDPAGGLRAVNVLYASFALAGVEDAGVALVDALRAQLGPGRTVWGVKHVAGVLSWELYVYDPGGARAEARPRAVLDALAPRLTVATPLPATPVPHHMFSVEVSRAALVGDAAAALTYYVHGDGGPGASRSYALGADGLRLANLYTFHDPRADVRAVIDRLRSSVHLGAPPQGVAAVLWPSLRRCRRICVANKPAADGVYFSGVDTDQLVAFVDAHGWPAPLRDAIDGRRHRYGHLAWDVGFDFDLPPGATTPRLGKSAIYATC
ncbi:MAG: hypothetical protein KC464_13760, partial [Myxococcales bacterium]|nr:hypothetical protein [Myxococcales bacterium]